jgi:hypothetical protein
LQPPAIGQASGVDGATVGAGAGAAGAQLWQAGAWYDWACRAWRASANEANRNRNKIARMANGRYGRTMEVLLEIGAQWASVSSDL